MNLIVVYFYIYISYTIFILGVYLGIYFSDTSFFIFIMYYN